MENRLTAFYHVRIHHAASCYVMLSTCAVLYAILYRTVELFRLCFTMQLALCYCKYTGDIL